MNNEFVWLKKKYVCHVCKEIFYINLHTINSFIKLSLVVLYPGAAVRGLEPNHKQPSPPVPTVRSSIPSHPTPGNAAPLAPARISGPAVSPLTPTASNKPQLNSEGEKKDFEEAMNS